MRLSVTSHLALSKVMQVTFSEKDSPCGDAERKMQGKRRDEGASGRSRAGSQPSLPTRMSVLVQCPGLSCHGDKG